MSSAPRVVGLPAHLCYALLDPGRPPLYQQGSLALLSARRSCQAAVSLLSVSCDQISSLFQQRLRKHGIGCFCGVDGIRSPDVQQLADSNWLLPIPLLDKLPCKAKLTSYGLHICLFGYTLFPTGPFSFFLATGTLYSLLGCTHCLLSYIVFSTRLHSLSS